MSFLDYDYRLLFLVPLPALHVLTNAFAAGRPHAFSSIFHDERICGYCDRGAS